LNIISDLIFFCFCRDAEPLVQWAKRAKATVESEPVASTGQGGVSADTIVISPQPSPLREAVTRFPLVGTGTDAPSLVQDKVVGEGYQEEERQEVDPTMVPPSTTIPESASPARASTDEPFCTKIVPASEATRDRVMATEVAGEGITLPPQAPTGNPLVFKHFSQIFFVFLNLTCKLIFILSFASVPLCSPHLS
jgi:hypothetical protein